MSCENYKQKNINIFLALIVIIFIILIILLYFNVINGKTMVISMILSILTIGMVTIISSVYCDKTQKKRDADYKFLKDRMEPID